MPRVGLRPSMLAETLHLTQAPERASCFAGGGEALWAQLAPNAGLEQQRLGQSLLFGRGHRFNCLITLHCILGIDYYDCIKRRRDIITIPNSSRTQHWGKPFSLQILPSCRRGTREPFHALSPVDVILDESFSSFQLVRAFAHGF